MTMMKEHEERIRAAFAVLVDAAPTGSEFEELTDTEVAPSANRRLNGAWAFALGFITVAVVGGLIAWANVAGEQSEMASVLDAPEEFEPDPETRTSLLDLIPDIPNFRSFSSTNPPTFDEYEQAALWTIECMESLGARVGYAGTDANVHDLDTPVVGIPSSQVYVWAVGPVEPGAAVGSGEQAEGFCRSIVFEEIATLYLNSATPTQIDRWITQLRACLIEQGIPGAESVRTASDVGGFAEETPNHCWP